MMDTIKVDAKGRFSIPSSLRRRLKMHEGDVYFIELEDEGVIRLAKAINPLDRSAAEAIDEYEAGQTMSLSDFARSEGFDLDDK